LTSTRTQAGATTAAPTAAPPTTARLVVRRATPAALTGVNGRPTRACALATDKERPSPCDQEIEPQTPHATTAATSNVRFAFVLFIAIVLFYENTVNICTRIILRACNRLSKPPTAGYAKNAS
jgi:hypothetical protein